VPEREGLRAGGPSLGRHFLDNEPSQPRQAWLCRHSRAVSQDERELISGLNEGNAGPLESAYDCVGIDRDDAIDAPPKEKALEVVVLCLDAQGFDVVRRCTHGASAEDARRPAAKPSLGVRLLRAPVDRIVERVERAFRQIAGDKPGVGPIVALNPNGDQGADTADPHHVHLMSGVAAATGNVALPQSLAQHEWLHEITAAPVSGAVPNQLAIRFWNVFPAGLFPAAAREENGGSEPRDHPDAFHNHLDHWLAVQVPRSEPSPPPHARKPSHRFMVCGTNLAGLVVSQWMEPREQLLAALLSVLVGLLAWLVVLRAFGVI
jgi:hypothetical protein